MTDFTMTAEQQEEFLEHMRAGLRRGAAAYAMDLTRLQVADYIEADEEFRHRVEDAESEAHEHVEEAIYQAALSGSVAAARLWMNMRKKPESALPVLYEGAEDDGDDDLEALMRLTTE